MTLHENPELFKSAIIATAQQLKIAEIYIEKDYWVTYSLKLIFQSQLASDTVFKGGTSLSKCYKVIKRFSEDIDLVVLRKDGENDNQLKRKIKAITELIASTVPEIEVEGITRKMGISRKTVHAYKKEDLTGKFGQIRDNIIIEATWLGSTEPYKVADIESFIAVMMKANGQLELLEHYELQPFSVKVLTMQRTLCEKIMSLVRFSHTSEPYKNLAHKIRHIYDIYMLLNNKEVYDFFKSIEFEKLLICVGKEDVQSFKNNNQWLAIHPKEAVVFLSPDIVWNEIRSTYRTTFRDFVIGDLPNETSMLSTLKKVSERLRSVRWKLNN